jgi:hypothetical protein
MEPLEATSPDALTYDEINFVDGSTLRIARINSLGYAVHEPMLPSFADNRAGRRAGRSKKLGRR